MILRIWALTWYAVGMLFFQKILELHLLFCLFTGHSIVKIENTEIRTHDLFIMRRVLSTVLQPIWVNDSFASSNLPTVKNFANPIFFITSPINLFKRIEMIQQKNNFNRIESKSFPTIDKQTLDKFLGGGLPGKKISASEMGPNSRIGLRRSCVKMRQSRRSELIGAFDLTAVDRFWPTRAPMTQRESLQSIILTLLTLCCASLPSSWPNNFVKEGCLQQIFESPWLKDS